MQKNDLIPIDIMSLEKVFISKEQKDNSKKFEIIVKTFHGSIMVLQFDEQEVGDWLNVLNYCRKEHHSEQEVYIKLTISMELVI